MGGLDPFLGFCLPLFSIVFPREFPSHDKPVEEGGSKSVVFCGQSTYKIFSCVFEISYLKQKGALSEAQRLAFRSKGDREIPDTRAGQDLE